MFVLDRGMCVFLQFYVKHTVNFEKKLSGLELRH